MRRQYQHSNKGCLPCSILSQHHNNLGVGKLTLSDSELKVSLGFTHRRILVPSIGLNVFCNLLCSLSNLKEFKVQNPMKKSASNIKRRIARFLTFTLNVSDSSRNRRFSVGTKPAKKILIPSLTENGKVTTPYAPGFPYKQQMKSDR